MQCENMKKLSDGQFRRIAGVKRDTFAKMLEMLQTAKVKNARKADPSRN